MEKTLTKDETIGNFNLIEKKVNIQLTFLI